jgi:hypothetical protein
VLFYCKTERYVWNPSYTAHDPEYVRTHYTQVSPDGRRWQADNLTAAGVRHGSSGQPWHGFDVASKGNHWKFTIENLERLEAEGRIYWPAKGGWPRYRRYLDEVRGTPLADMWTDIPPINAQAGERLGYPTQKPLALLQRIIRASSNPGDLVLDPFCGCGTAVHAAEKEERQWVGIDVTYLAIGVMRNRMEAAFPGLSFTVHGEPADGASAKALFDADPYQFQWWTVGLLRGQPTRPEKKGGDRGVDGRLVFVDDQNGSLKKVVISVKGGATNPSDVRDLHGVCDRENALGVFVTLRPPTREMRGAATAAGTYTSPLYNRVPPKIQIVTTQELLSHRADPRAVLRLPFTQPFQPQAKREPTGAQLPLMASL